MQCDVEETTAASRLRRGVGGGRDQWRSEGGPYVSGDPLKPYFTLFSEKRTFWAPLEKQSAISEDFLFFGKGILGPQKDRGTPPPLL